MRFSDVARDFTKTLFERGAITQLTIDARRRDVSIPDFLRDCGARLVIDVIPSDQIHAEIGEDAIEVTLAFRGCIERCTFPWSAVWCAIERGTLHGASLAEEPAAPENPWTPVVPMPKKRSGLTLVRGGKA